MTDRELLELAAKAAGMTEFSTASFWSKGYRVRDGSGDGWYPWNPLADDADALRLAVSVSDKIRDGFRIMLADYNDPFVCVDRWSYETLVRERTEDGGTMAATRRAIVRAAAEIGRKMP